MDEQAQLWGTVSVLDHKRPNAFVAELGLFDALVVPVPPPDGGGNWAGKWDGAAQDRLLSLIPDDRLRRVPWDEGQRGAWARWARAEDAGKDVAAIQQDRQDYVAGGGTPATARIASNRGIPIRWLVGCAKRALPSPARRSAGPK